MAALATGAIVAAQGGQKPGGAPLLIDFTAVGADGKPVEGLTPADVTIRVGGKARTVTSLELKKVSAAPAAAPTAGAPAAAAPSGDITPPFATNEASAAPAPAAAGGAINRSVLIVIDNESLVPAAEAGFKAGVSALLEGLAPGDRVGFALAPRDTAQVGFTTLARVREALGAVRGVRPANVSSADSLCRTSQTLALLTSLLGQVASSPTPTSVVLIAGSLSTPGRADGSSGTCEVVAGDYRRVADTAAASRVNMFVVQGDSGAQGRSEGLEMLAGDTGAGAVMRVTGEGFAPRVLSAASTYWVATLAPDPSDRVGQAQVLDVKTTKEGVTLNSRKYAAPSAAPVAGPAAAAAAPKGPVSPKDMIASQAQFTDLQLRGYAFAQRGAGDKVNVFVQVEPADPSVKLTAVRFGYFDAANKGAALDAPKIGTYPVTTILPLTPGQYRIRMAATDASGKSGAVDVNLNANLISAGPFKISGLLIGASEGAGNMVPRFTYKTEEKILVLFELYGPVTAETKMRVGFEIASADAGPTRKDSSFTPIGVRPTNEPDKFQVFGEIPINDLPPGDYVIRAVVQAEGQPEGKSLRTIRILPR